MRKTYKYKLIGVLQFIVASIVIIYSGDIDSTEKFDNLKEEVSVENNSCPVKTKPTLEIAHKIHDKSSQVYNTPDYYLNYHYNLPTLKQKYCTYQPAIQIPVSTLKSRSVRITQFDEL